MVVLTEVRKIISEIENNLVGKQEAERPFENSQNLLRKMVSSEEPKGSPLKIELGKRNDLLYEGDRNFSKEENHLDKLYDDLPEKEKE